MVYYGNRHSNKGNVDDLISNLFTSFVIMSFFIFYTSNWFTYLLVYFVILSFLYSKLVHFFIILSLIG